MAGSITVSLLLVVRVVEADYPEGATGSDALARTIAKDVYDTVRHRSDIAEPESVEVLSSFTVNG